MHVFAVCAKEFIHRSTVTYVIPPTMSYLRKLALMTKDCEMHQTLIARQSRTLLRKMIDGLWEFMTLLELGELESDPIIDQMIDFIESSKELQVTYDNIAMKRPNDSNEFLHYFDPLRVMDNDILWLKLYSNKNKRANIRL